MSSDTHAAILILVMACVTFLLRFLPFLLFGKEGKTPRWVLYLGNVLPQAAIGMLVIYCLRTVSFATGTHGLPELVACATVIALQAWKDNSVLSIASGTAVYMVLIRLFMVQ